MLLRHVSRQVDPDHVNKPGSDLVYAVTAGDLHR